MRQDKSTEPCTFSFVTPTAASAAGTPPRRKGVHATPSVVFGSGSSVGNARRAESRYRLSLLLARDVLTTARRLRVTSRGPKLDFYKALASVQEILILSHRAPRVSLHRREPDGTWTSQEVSEAGSIELRSVGATLALDEVYRDFGSE